MRFSVAALTIFGVVASASASLLSRQASAYPACAQPCLLTANLGSCGQTDIKCLCQSSAFVTSTNSCINSSCKGDDLTKAVAAAQGACAQVGVTLSSTAAATGASGSSTATSPAGSSTGASSSSATSSAPQTSSTSNGAATHGINAVAGLAAIGLAALAL